MSVIASGSLAVDASARDETAREDAATEVDDGATKAGDDDATRSDDDATKAAGGRERERSRLDGRHHRIAIVGAGFAGLGTAIRLRQAGVEDFVVLERAQEIGGTWEANTYPGCQCDVPSHLYSFSFALNPDWSRTFSTQPEIQRYLRRVANEQGVREKLELRVALQRADWSQQDQLWRLRTSAGTFTAEILVSGMGVLTEPSLPAIEGLDSFAGACFHTARWDASQSLAGKRVGVIGTGASTIQIVPKIQPEVAQLRVFQRTPPWIIPHRDRRVTAAERALFKAFPRSQRLLRQAIYWARELYVLPFLHPALGRPGEALARRHLASQVADPDLRRRLTPSYRIGCKRVLLSDEYYPALQRENARLVTEPIERIVPSGIVTRDGELHELDAIVLGTGFHVTDVPYAPHIRGRGGVSLEQAWGGSPKTHLGTTVAGFPNLFLLLGPYTALGHTSVVVMIECQIAYLLDCVAKMDARAVRSVEPRAEAQATFLQEMGARARGTVWSSGGCASWYLDAEGRPSAIWPASTWHFRRRLRSFQEREYVVKPQTLAAPRIGGPRGQRGEPQRGTGVRA
ncbi:MAG: flavin-containing monooxygenase [Solirubrobacteraceae bacterium]